MNEVRPFDPEQAGPDELRDYGDLMIATFGDWSDDPVPDFATLITQLKSARAGQGPARRWAAYSDDRLVGLATAWIPEGENGTVGIVRVNMHPEFRRRGLGTELLRQVVRALRAERRTHAEAWLVQQGGPGERWASGLGFLAVEARVAQRMLLESADETLWDVPMPAGYREARWCDSAPDDLIETYVAARGAVRDAPVVPAGVSSHRAGRSSNCGTTRRPCGTAGQRLTSPDGCRSFRIRSGWLVGART